MNSSRETSDDEFSTNVILEVPSWTAKEVEWAGTIRFWWLYLLPPLALASLIVALFLKELSAREATMALQAPWLLGIVCYAISAYELRVLQGRGYLKLYRSTANELSALPFILSLGNSILLGLWTWVPSPLEQTSNNAVLSGANIVQILVSCEFLVILPFMIIFLVQVSTHITTRKPPDLNADSVQNIKGGLWGAKAPTRASSDPYTSSIQSTEDFVGYFEAQEQRIRVLSKEILLLKEQLASKNS